MSKNLIKKFKYFKYNLEKVLPELIGEILSFKREEKVYGIAFITTDDLYGMYVAFQTEETQKENIEELKKLGIQQDSRWFPNEWKYSSDQLKGNYSKELYTNLVSIVEKNHTINLLEPSKEKWEFISCFIKILQSAVISIDSSVFEKYGYKREDIVFLTTMSDGDYMECMKEESIQLFNSYDALKNIL